MKLRLKQIAIIEQDLEEEDSDEDEEGDDEVSALS